MSPVGPGIPGGGFVRVMLAPAVIVASTAMKVLNPVDSIPSGTISASRDIPVLEGSRYSVPEEKYIAMIDQNALEGFIRLAESDPSKECGAICVGTIYTDPLGNGTVAVITDMFTDNTFGTDSSYVISNEMQIRCMDFLRNKYDGSRHVIGTIHSHSVHHAYLSDTDRRMIESRRSDEVHLVVSPTFKELGITIKDRQNGYHGDVAVPGYIEKELGYKKVRI